MTAALLAVITGTGNILLDKYLLSRQKMAIAQYIPLLFGFLFLITVLTLPWLGAYNAILVGNQQFMFYFVLMILLAIMWNIFYYQGLQKEKMVEFEMILLLTPLATVILATIFFPEEFNPQVFAAALVGALVLFLSHVRKQHLEFDKYAMHLVLAVFLMAMEAMVQKELLTIYSPALLYAVRTGFLAAFFALYYKPDLHKVSNRQFNAVFVTAVLGSVGMISKFYGFQELGVTFTTLVLLLVPILASWLDAVVNKTKIRKRTILAFVVILCCVGYAILYQ